MLASLTSGATSSVDVVPKSTQSQKLVFLDRVVSFQSLKHRLLGMQILEVDASAVLTPAARDYCKELNVEIVRSRAIERTKNTVVGTGSLAGTLPQRLVVAGTPTWMPSIAKQLCAKQAKVHDRSTDDSSALTIIADGLRFGHQAGVAIVNAPHATCWQAARDDRLRPAVVSNWSELNDVMREVPVNVLILSLKHWNVPSACNAARRLFQHLQHQS